MRIVIDPNFEAWREASRSLLDCRVDPASVEWDDGSETQISLTSTAPAASLAESQAAPRHRVPVRFHELARMVSAHRSPDRWSLLYRLLHRVTFDNRKLLEMELDDDVREAFRLEKQVRRDIHKTHAFVRFRLVRDDGGDRYVAWYKPDHFILPLAAPFFAERFPVMRWSILTPDVSAHWAGSELSFTDGLPRDAAPAEDELEEMWKTYYGSIFNPARIKLAAMRSEMPTRFWSAMPETKIIPRLLEEAPARVARRIELQNTAPTAQRFVPADRSIDVLRKVAAKCEGCELHTTATQTVFGEGPSEARIVLVGEQPGDQEDLQGRPFVGPAGEVFDQALALAGLDRAQLYITNAVKHFKFEERGKWRIHRTPRAVETVACRPWLEAELETIQPEIVVAMGATAAKSLFGGGFQLLKQRGRVFESRWAVSSLATIHPSAILRSENEALKAQFFDFLVHDLRLASSRCTDGASVR